MPENPALDKVGPCFINNLVGTVLGAIEVAVDETLNKVQHSEWSVVDAPAPRVPAAGKLEEVREVVRDNLMDSFMASFLPKVGSKTLCMEKLEELLKMAMDQGERYLSKDEKNVLAGSLAACFQTGMSYDHLGVSTNIPPRDLSEVVQLRPCGKTVYSLMQELSRMPGHLLVEPVKLTVADFRTPGERLKIEPAPY